MSKKHFFWREMKVLERKMIWIERILRFSSKKREKFVIWTAKTKCQRGKSVLVISNDILQVFESIFQVQEIVMSVLFDYGFVLWLQPIIQISSVFITISFFQNDLCFILEGEGECLMILTSIIDLWSSSSSSRILCCSPRVYSTIEKWNVKQLERKTSFTFCAFRNLLSTLDDRFSRLIRTRLWTYLRFSLTNQLSEQQTKSTFLTQDK